MLDPRASTSEALRLARQGDHRAAVEAALCSLKKATEVQIAHGLLATLYLQNGERIRAKKVLEEATLLPGGEADAHDGLGHAFQLVGDEKLAAKHYCIAIGLNANDPALRYNLATMLQRLGLLDEAEKQADAAIALEPRYYQAYLLRSGLRVQSHSSNHVSEMLRLLRTRHIEDRGRLMLGYAVAKELDDLDEFDEAFDWYRRSSALRRDALQYDVTADIRKIERIIESYPDTAVSDSETEVNSVRHIFVTGLPRSGTTLTERILLGLKGTASNGETDNFAKSLMDNLPAGPGDVFARSSRAVTQHVAASYNAAAKPSSGIVSAVIEKMPSNYLYLGAINRSLPTAALVLTERPPVESCFAMFRTLFGVGYPFSYSFDDLASYYAAYARLITHWQRKLGERLFRISYSALVSETHDVASAMATYCGLEWVPTALAIEQSSRSSSTASAAQIRRPIYTSSDGRWRRYERHLGPLSCALRAQGISKPEALLS